MNNHMRFVTHFWINRRPHHISREPINWTASIILMLIIIHSIVGRTWSSLSQATEFIGFIWLWQWVKQTKMRRI